MSYCYEYASAVFFGSLSTIYELYSQMLLLV